MTRYLVLRVPSVGPPALVGHPSDFATLHEAESRMDEIYARQSKTHHTTIRIESYQGDKYEYMERKNILY